MFNTTPLGKEVREGKEYMSFWHFWPYYEDGGALLREGRLWEYDNKRNEEVLVMDLSLKEGDLFLVPNSYYLDEHLTFQVLQVYYKGGLKHIKFRQPYNTNCILYGEFNLEFIEGTGPNMGIFYRTLMHDEDYFDSYLLCHMKDGESVYTGPLTPNGCSPLSATEEIAGGSRPTATAFPNPTKETVTISFQKAYSGMLLLFDQTGKLHLQGFVSHASDYQLALPPALPPGMYQLRLTDGKGVAQTLRFVKN